MRIARVLFPNTKHPVIYDAQDLDFKEGDLLVVEKPRGIALAKAVSAPQDTGDETPPAEMIKILRLAGADDLHNQEMNSSKEAEAHALCLERIHSRELPMKLVKTEYLFDGSKVIFYFTSEGRVDFRELVRDLARQLRTRIEMVQIGVRDEAKLMGGIGICGREFCCATFLQSFVPVSIKMAKDQSLSLNPSKVSGACGRLMCCLAYEFASYVDFREGLPKIGKRCMCPFGPGRVGRFDIVKQKVIVTLEDGREVEVERDQITKLPPAQ